MKRAQIDNIIKDLSKKIGIIVGPRQVGKTYVAKQIANAFLPHPLPQL
jgi:predicted AAA+ superfamily ATPase